MPQSKCQIGADVLAATPEGTASSFRQFHSDDGKGSQPIGLHTMPVLVIQYTLVSLTPYTSCLLFSCLLFSLSFIGAYYCYHGTLLLIAVIYQWVIWTKVRSCHIHLRTVYFYVSVRFQLYENMMVSFRKDAICENKFCIQTVKLYITKMFPV